MKCTICGRKLRSPKSRELGYGPVCYKKASGKAKAGKGTGNGGIPSVKKCPAYEMPGQMTLMDYLQ